MHLKGESVPAGAVLLKSIIVNTFVPYAVEQFDCCIPHILPAVTDVLVVSLENVYRLLAAAAGLCIAKVASPGGVTEDVVAVVDPSLFVT